MINIDEIEAWLRGTVPDWHMQDLEALFAEVRRCHARLEIDHAWRPARDGETPERDGLVREPIPYERRASEPDGIECRDATIAMLQERLAWSQAENARLREAIPDAEERRHLGTLRRMTLPAHVLLYPERRALEVFEAWLARLDAARKGGT